MSGSVWRVHIQEILENREEVTEVERADMEVGVRDFRRKRARRSAD